MHDQRGCSALLHSCDQVLTIMRKPKGTDPAISPMQHRLSGCHVENPEFTLMLLSVPCADCQKASVAIKNLLLDKWWKVGKHEQRSIILDLTDNQPSCF